MKIFQKNENISDLQLCQAGGVLPHHVVLQDLLQALLVLGQLLQHRPGQLRDGLQVRVEISQWSRTTKILCSDWSCNASSLEVRDSHKDTKYNVKNGVTTP